MFAGHRGPRKGNGCEREGANPERRFGGGGSAVRQQREIFI